MGGNGVQGAQGQTIVCEFRGATVGADVGRLRAEIVELVRRKAAGSAVRHADSNTLEIAADLDAQAIEMLRLEIRRLARRYGADGAGLRVERVLTTA
jgi:hypothetical protein